jgi:chemotaxis protein methyltransferase CheR
MTTTERHTVHPERTRARPAGGGWHFRAPSAGEYAHFTTMIHEVAGISLNDSKRALVERRLNARMRTLGLESLGAYVAYVQEDASGQELVHCLDLIVTNETHFFRERPHWEFLEQRVLPKWAAEAEVGERPRRVRAWSAACSFGQEPYSLAMQLHSQLPLADSWEHEIVATDISTHALERASQAEWSIELAHEIPEPFLKRFMLRGVGESQGRMRASRELRAAVQFGRLNLNEPQYALTGTFDLIFCRNVLIYFSPEGRAAVIERLTDRLAPGGLLFVGHAESLHAHRLRLRAVLPTVYARAT